MIGNSPQVNEADLDWLAERDQQANDEAERNAWEYERQPDNGLPERQ